MAESTTTAQMMQGSVLPAALEAPITAGIAFEHALVGPCDVEECSESGVVQALLARALPSVPDADPTEQESLSGASQAVCTGSTRTGPEKADLAALVHSSSVLPACETEAAS